MYALHINAHVSRTKFAAFHILYTPFLDPIHISFISIQFSVEKEPTIKYYVAKMGMN